MTNERSPQRGRPSRAMLVMGVLSLLGLLAMIVSLIYHIRDEPILPVPNTEPVESSGDGPGDPGGS